MASPASFVQALHLKPGIICVIGSGGKTSLLKVLAEGLQGTVILTTTTHILPFRGITAYETTADAGLCHNQFRELRQDSSDKETLCRIRELLLKHRIVQVGTPLAGQVPAKYAPPSIPIRLLAPLADVCIVEADGARHLPLKAHAPFEPVIPALSSRVLCVVGAGGFGLSVSTAVHRPDIFCARSGLSMHDSVTPKAAASVLLQEALSFDTIIINQVNSKERAAYAKELADRLHKALPTVSILACQLPLPDADDRSVSYTLL